MVAPLEPGALQQLRSLLDDLENSDTCDPAMAEILKRLVRNRIAAFEALQRLQSEASRPPKEP